MAAIKAGDMLSGDKFYKVLKVTAKTIVLQQMGSKIDRSIDFEGNSYHWSIATNEPIGEPFRCTLSETENCQDVSSWWIPKYGDSVVKYDRTPISWKTWNYGDNNSRIAFDQSLYNSAK